MCLLLSLSVFLLFSQTFRSSSLITSTMMMMTHAMIDRYSMDSLWTLEEESTEKVVQNSQRERVVRSVPLARGPQRGNRSAR